MFLVTVKFKDGSDVSFMIDKYDWINKMRWFLERTDEVVSYTVYQR